MEEWAFIDERELQGYRRAAASASPASTSTTGWISTATPCWAATSGSSSCQGEHLKKKCKFWVPTWLVPGDD